MLSYDLYFLWSNLASVVLFLVHFISKALWERGHSLSYYLCDLCISVHSTSWIWSRNVFCFFSPWESQKNEKRWQQDNMYYQKEQQEIAFVSILLDSIWIVFVTEIMWLIYIVRTLWSSKHFKALSLILKPCYWLGIWQHLSSLCGLEDCSLKDVTCAAIWKVFGKLPMELTEEDFLLYL